MVHRLMGHRDVKQREFEAAQHFVRLMMGLNATNNLSIGQVEP